MQRKPVQTRAADIHSQYIVAAKEQQRSLFEEKKLRKSLGKVKRIRAYGGCLGTKSRRRTR